MGLAPDHEPGRHVSLRPTLAIPRIDGRLVFTRVAAAISIVLVAAEVPPDASA
jgi:hypothetical protein